SEVKSLRKNLIATLVIALGLAISASNGSSQDGGLKVTGSLPKNPLPPPSTSGPIQLQHTLPVPQQETQSQTVPNSDANRFEHHDSVISIPRMLNNQWALGKSVPPENLISGRYIRSLDTAARSLTLKEAIYIALRNNPALASAQLDPVAAVET